MKNLKHFFVTFVLTSTLSISALAGEMPGAGMVAAQPPSVETTGEMPGAGIATPATEILLAVLENILSIF